MAGSGSASVTRWRKRGGLSPSCMSRTATGGGVARERASRHQINAAAFGCDITDDAAVAKVVDDVAKRFGRLDILVNDAAYNKSIPFPDLDDLTMEVWDKIIAVNLTGPMRLTKAGGPG